MNASSFASSIFAALIAIASSSYVSADDRARPSDRLWRSVRRVAHIAKRHKVGVRPCACAV
jgi:hypothetical protein